MNVCGNRLNVEMSFFYMNDLKSCAKCTVISSELFWVMAVKFQLVHLSCTMVSVDLLKSSHGFTEKTLDQER